MHQNGSQNIAHFSSCPAYIFVVAAILDFDLDLFNAYIYHHTNMEVSTVLIFPIVQTDGQMERIYIQFPSLVLKGGQKAFITYTKI